MEQPKPRKSKSTNEIENCLDYYEIRIKRSFRDPKFVLEFLGFVVLTVYAIFTIAMYFANRDAARAATKAADTAALALEAQNRAWLGIALDDGYDAKTHKPNDSPIRLGDRFLEPFRYVDTGRGPAVEIGGVVKAALVVGKDNLPNFGNTHCETTFDHGDILSVGQSSSTGYVDVCLDSPNSSRALTSVDEPITGNYFGNGYIVRFGRIHYRDLLPPKKEHFIQFCNFRVSHLTAMTARVMRACLQYNQVDEE
jgi:hypothetical protein